MKIVSTDEGGDDDDYYYYDDDDAFWIEIMKSSFKFKIQSTTTIKNSMKIGIKLKNIKKRCKK